MSRCPTCGAESAEPKPTGRELGLAEAQKRFGTKPPDARVIAQLQRMGIQPDSSEPTS